MKDTFNTYNTTQDKEYLVGLKRLRDIYREAGIDFDRYMDTTDMDEYIQVGMFIGEDLYGYFYGVASYNTQTKRFTIDEDEIVASVDAYREDNQ